ncbi:MAG: tetratricopeptide repeat protein [Blastocatellia bacterium]|nr:tetratricopeptide repeat protein [Blastocatellia bacterium]
MAKTIAILNPKGVKQCLTEMLKKNYSTFCAPELFFVNPSSLTRQSDIYSFGAICYYLLSGTIPFSTKATEVKDQPTYITDSLTPLLTLSPEIGIWPSLEKLIVQSLSQDPEARPKSLEEFTEELSKLGSSSSNLVKTAKLQKEPHSDQTPTIEVELETVFASETLSMGAVKPEVAKASDKEMTANATSTPQTLTMGAVKNVSDTASTRTDQEGQSKKDVLEPVAFSVPKLPVAQASVTVEPNRRIDSSKTIKVERSKVTPEVKDKLHTASSSPEVAAEDSPKRAVEQRLAEQIYTQRSPEVVPPVATVKSKTVKVPFRYWLMFIMAGLAFIAVTGTFSLFLFEPEVGSIVVTTVPAGAEIILDGKTIGVAPAEIEEVPVGTHKLQIIKNGFDKIEKDVIVVKKQVTNLPTIALQSNKPVTKELVVTGSPQERTKEFNVSADEAFNRGEYILPEDSSAFYYTDAVLKIDPDDDIALARKEKIREEVLKQAEAARQKGDFATAQQLYNRLIEKFPDDKQATDGLRRVEVELSARRGQLNQLLEQGENAFTNGRYVEPQNSSAYYYASQMLAIERGNQPAIKLKNRIKEALLREADTVAKTDTKTATEKYQQLIRLFPEDKKLVAQVRILKEKQSQQVVVQSDSNSLRASGLRKYANNDFAGAIADLDSAIKAGNQDPDIYFYLASAHLKQGRVSEAVRYYNAVLEKNPSHSGSLAQLAQIAENRKEYTTALNYYEKMLRYGPTAEYPQSFLEHKIQTLKLSIKSDPDIEPFSASVNHDHGFIGSCSGTLSINAQGVRYYSSSNDHGFSVPLASISDLELSGSDKISFRVVGKKDKYTFRFSSKNADRFRQSYYDFLKVSR